LIIFHFNVLIVMMKTLCTIPVYNEDSKLIDLINQIKKYPYQNYNLDYLFINNGSTDYSAKIIKSNNFKFLNLKKNMGVGYALMLGYFYAKKYKYDNIVHLAGNGKMNPANIHQFLFAINNEGYDFVSGSRFLKGATKKNNPIYRIILIKFFSYFIGFWYKKKISDSTCGFRAFKVKIFKNFKKNFFKKELFTYGYEYFSYGKILNNRNVKFVEIPVSMNYPSKKNYTKIRPIIDWFIIAKYWIKGLNDKSEL